MRCAALSLLAVCACGPPPFELEVVFVPGRGVDPGDVAVRLGGQRLALVYHPDFDRDGFVGAARFGECGDDEHRRELSFSVDVSGARSDYRHRQQCRCPQVTIHADGSHDETYPVREVARIDIDADGGIFLGRGICVFETGEQSDTVFDHF